MTCFEQGDLLAQAAIDQAEHNADDMWLRAARSAVQQLIADGRPFTTDDVWQRLDRLAVTTHEPRALGAVIRAAARSGLIVNSGSYCKSTRPDCHSRPIPQWLPRRVA